MLSGIHFGDLLQLVNLVLIPILIYIVKLERKLAVLEVTRDHALTRLATIEGDVRAVHKRLDRYGVPHASAKPS